MESEFVKACRSGDANLVQQLTASRYPFMIDIHGGFFAACSNGHTAVVKLLLLDKRIEYNPSPGLLHAVTNDHPAVAKLLIDHRNVYPYEAFLYAIEHDLYEMVQIFLQHPNIDPNYKNGQILHYAMIHNHIDLVKLLLIHPRINVHAPRVHDAMDIISERSFYNYVRAMVSVHRGIYKEIRTCIHMDVTRFFLRKIFEFLRAYDINLQLNPYEQEILNSLEREQESIVVIGKSLTKRVGLDTAMQMMKNDPRVYRFSMYPSKTDQQKFEIFKSMCSK